MRKNEPGCNAYAAKPKEPAGHDSRLRGGRLPGESGHQGVQPGHRYHRGEEQPSVILSGTETSDDVTVNGLTLGDLRRLVNDG